MSSVTEAPELVAPAHLWVPDRHSSLGAEAVDLAAAVGLDLDLEQQLMADAILSVRADGTVVALEACVIEPRQNGKTVAFEAAALADLFLFAEPHDLFVWTAHRYKTTVEAFRDLDRLIDGSAMLSRRVKRILRSFGDESIELMDGTRLNFLAREKTGGRGLGGRRVMLDEAFAVTAGIMGSLFPIMSAQVDAQIRYASSASLPSSDVLRGLSERGRRGGDPGLVLAEWAAERFSCERGQRCDHALNASGCALDDPEKLRAANHTAGRRISWEYLAKERRAFSATPELRRELARERLGWHDELDTQTRVISAADWTECLDATSSIVGDFTVAVDVEPDRSMSSIAVCGRRRDGRPHVEVAALEPGTNWVVAKLTAMGAQTVHLNGAGAPNSLIPDIEAAGIDVTPATARTLAQGCGAFQDAAVGHSLAHIGQTGLDQALAGARKRELSAAWAWDRKDVTVVLAPLVAVTLAHWAWLTDQLPADYDPLASIGASRKPSEE